MKKLLLLFAFLTISQSFNAQVGISNTDPKASLDITASSQATPSNTDGILIPRIDEFPVSDPGADQDGMLVFVTGAGSPSEGFYYWDNGSTSWITMSGGIDTTNTLDEAYDDGGAGNGRIITADNGSIEIQGTGGLRVEGNIVSGEQIIHDGDPDTFMEFSTDGFQLDAGGRNYIDVQHTNQEIVFNEDSTESNFRVESNNQANMLLVDGSNDAIGIGEANPRSPLHIGISTSFDLSYANTGQDGLFVDGGGDNSGLNAYGGSIGFGPASPVRKGQRKAAIALIQTGGDSDFTGLGFFVHGNPINQSPMVEAMRLTHAGNLGLGTTSPDATLDVVGTMQFVDGNQAAGYVMQSDALGNVSWADPGILAGDAWYEEGTTTAPSSINDDIYTQGFVAIGQNTADSSLDILRNDAANDPVIVAIQDSSTGTGTHTGIQMEMGGTHNESIEGTAIYINNTGTGLHTGYLASVSSGGGNQRGIRASTNGSNGQNTGVSAAVLNSGSASTFIQTGISAQISQPTSQITYGLFNTLTASGVNATGIKYGIYNLIDGGTTNAHYGLYNDVRGTNNNSKYGVYNRFGIGTTNTDGILYGTYNDFGTSISSSFNKYGTYTIIPSSLNGTHYGIYSDVRNANGYAGYFIGRTSFGNSLSNRYVLPSADGVAGQVMETDGSGNLSWVTPSGGVSTANNGLSLSGSEVRLGGSLTQSTNIAFGNFPTSFNLSGSGGFFIQDGGVNFFRADANGNIGIGNSGVPAYQLDVVDAQSSNFVANIENQSTSTNADGLSIRLITSVPSSLNHYIGFYRNATSNTGSIRGQGASIIYATSSDGRLKTKVRNISNALAKIKTFQPKLYEFISNPGTEEYGFIAQQLQKVYPQAVAGEPDSDVQTAPMMVDYGRLSPILTAGLLELNQKVEDLMSENEELKARLARLEALEARLIALESNGSVNSSSDISETEK